MAKEGDGERKMEREGVEGRRRGWSGRGGKEEEEEEGLDYTTWNQSTQIPARGPGKNAGSRRAEPSGPDEGNRTEPHQTKYTNHTEKQQQANQGKKAGSYITTKSKVDMKVITYPAEENLTITN